MSLPDIRARIRHVRFPPESGHSQASKPMSTKCQELTSSLAAALVCLVPEADFDAEESITTLNRDVR